MTRLLTALALSIVLGLVALTVSAAPQAPVFRSAAQTVPIYATVTDSTGRLVPDLEEQHFEVFDNGVRQPLTIFKSDVQPITTVIMLDTSGSMTLNRGFLFDAAERFVLRLLPEDRARIGDFSEKIRISPQFTSNRDDLIRILRTDMRFGNGTHLWDAIDDSMTALSAETGRRVVLVFTDGNDDKSRRNDFDAVFRRAQSDGYMVYAIGLEGSIPATGQRFTPDRNLRRLAEETGGGYFHLRTTADLNTTFTRIADELHRQYVLGFAVEKLDGLVHKLDVRTKLPGMTVRARRTYVAKAGAMGDPTPTGAPRP